VARKSIFYLQYILVPPLPSLLSCVFLGDGCHTSTPQMGFYWTNFPKDPQWILTDKTNSSVARGPAGLERVKSMVSYAKTVKINPTKAVL
jgi:hypothetical protein